MPRRRRDLTGQRFGLLTALEPFHCPRRDAVLWRCRCDCGGEARASVSDLTRGNSRSCGCRRGRHRERGEEEASAPPVNYHKTQELEL